MLNSRLHVGDEACPLLFLPDVTALVIRHFKNTITVQNICELFFACIHMSEVIVSNSVLRLQLDWRVYAAAGD